MIAFRSRSSRDALARSAGRVLLSFALVCAAFAGGLSSARAQSHEGVLVLGRISDDPKSHYEPLKRLLDYVVPRMRDVGIREGKVLMAKDAQQMASYLRRGQVDWVTETAATAVQLQERARAQPLLLTERNGVSRYRSLIFVRRDSGIGDLGQLRGRSIAFQNTASTSAYFVPAIELLRRDLALSLLLSPMDRPSGDSVGYVFARSELNIGAWVHKRLVDAGAMSELDWNDPARLPPTYRDDLLVIHTSDPIPRALEMTRSDLDPRVRERLIEVLMQAANDTQAREPLKYFFRTTRFLPLDTPTRQGLERLREGAIRVRKEVE
ncbi:MAG: phosphate/phosphite/phosphonate ABC transporter substrate-binding protein [Lysobacter sp.]|nr:MAG: phosphate/phosphite/phosphonate ABC transporter substrate-binding protein [Lysobacter sp.]